MGAPDLPPDRSSDHPDWDPRYPQPRFLKQRGGSYSLNIPDAELAEVEISLKRRNKVFVLRWRTSDWWNGVFPLIVPFWSKNVDEGYFEGA